MEPVKFADRLRHVARGSGDAALSRRPRDFALAHAWRQRSPAPWNAVLADTDMCANSGACERCLPNMTQRGAISARCLRSQRVSPLSSALSARLGPVLCVSLPAEAAAAAGRE